MSRPQLLLYRFLLKRAKVYGEVVGKRQLGSQKEISGICSRIGLGSEVAERLDSSSSISESLQDEIKKQFHVRAQETSPTIVSAEISKAFCALRAINERLNFLSVLPDSTISSTTTNFANIQIESYSISVTPSKRPRGQSIGKDPGRAYTFAYKVTISHIGHQDAPPFRVQTPKLCLTNENEEVELVPGDFVSKKNPRLCAGESFVYSSFCTVSTPLGVMKGHFVLFDEVKGSIFEAEVDPLRLDVRHVPSKEQAEDLEATIQTQAVPIRYKATSPERVSVQ